METTVRTLNRLTLMLAVAAIVLFTHSEAQAQILQFTNPLILNLANGASATSGQVNVTLSGATVTSPSTLSIQSISVSSGSGWLCATTTGATINVSAGSACPGAASLAAGSYTGIITFTGTGATNTAQLTVDLSVTSGVTGTNGLVSSPASLNFPVSVGSGFSSQTTSITLNGILEQITSVSFSTVTGESWLSATPVGTGQLQVTVNTAALGLSNDSGTVLVTTSVGQLSIPVTISTNGSSSFGLVASPSSLSFNVGVGSGATSQNFVVLENGSPVTVTSLSENTNTGVSWLTPSPSGSTGGVTVLVNPSFLGQAGSYTGTVSASTGVGVVQVPVTVNVGTSSSSGLSVSQNPVTFNLLPGGGISTQYVTVTLNGAGVTLSGVSSTTTTGQAWLSASISGFNGQVQVTANPTTLFSSGNYQGTVTVQTTVGVVSFGVTLNLGSGSTSGLVASPSSVNFNIPLIGSGVSPQNVSVTLNGVAEPIQTTSFVLNSGQNWLLVSSTGTGMVTVGTNGAAFTSAGTYTATVTVNTGAGTLTIPVSVTVGSGSTSGLVATPSPLTVNVPLGSGSSSQNISVTYNGVAASITGVSTSTSTGQGWLQASSGSGQGIVVVTTNPAAVGSSVAGSYSGTVFISTTLGQLSVQVNMNVGSSGSAAGLSATPNPVSFSGVAGGASSSQNVTITSNGSPVTVTSVNASTTTGQAWLQPSFFASNPGSVTVSVNPSILTASGTYTGTVTVNTTSGTTSFQVNLAIGGGTSTSTSGLAATPNPVNFTQSAPGQSQSQNIVVTLNGVQQTVTSTTFVNTPILNPTFVNTQINPDGSVTLTLNNVVTTPGFYQGTITLYTAGGGSIAVPVTLAFGSGGSSSGLSANPSVLNLSSSVGAGATSQNVSILYNGSAVTVSGVSATTTTGQNWLQPSFTQAVPGTVTVTVNPSVLSGGGTYSGTVSVTTPIGQTSFQVNLSLGGGVVSTNGLTASPNPVSFSVSPGGATSSQNVGILFNGVAVGISGVSVTTSNGQSWLQALNNGFGSVTVTVNPSVLSSVGTYSGTVTVNTTSGTLSFQVNVTVGGGSTSNSLVLSSSALSFSFTVGSTGPAQQTITVSSNGTPQSFTATASASTGGSWLSVSPTTLSNTPATLTVTVNTANLTPPTGTSPVSYSGTILIAPSTGGIAPISVPVSITVTPSPVVTPNVVEIINYASSIATPLSPGLNVGILGSNLGPATKTNYQLGSNGNLATTLAGTQVTFGGVVAPIVYTSANEVSVMVPYEIANQTSTAVVVTYNGVASNPINLRVAAAAPGLYTLLGNGSGQAAILNQDGTVNSIANPESSPRIISLFGTGEGVISPAQADGTINPNGLPQSSFTQPVTVTFGTPPNTVTVPAASITYSGEAPTLFSGIFQINVRIPAGLTGNVPIAVSIGGVSSQSNVTVSLH